MARVSCKWGRTHFRVRRSTYCYCCSLLEWQMNFSSCNWYEIDKISREWLLLLLAFEIAKKSSKREQRPYWINTYTLQSIPQFNYWVFHACRIQNARLYLKKQVLVAAFSFKKFLHPLLPLSLSTYVVPYLIFSYIGKKSKSYPWALKTYTVSDCKTIESVLAIFLPRNLCVWLEMISK